MVIGSRNVQCHALEDRIPGLVIFPSLSRGCDCPEELFTEAPRSVDTTTDAFGLVG